MSSPWVLSSSNIYFNIGSVGIGSSAPTRALDVNGSVAVSGTITSAGNTSIYYKTLSGSGTITSILGPGSLVYNNVFIQGSAVTQLNNTTFTINYPGLYTVLMTTSIQSQGAFVSHYGIGVNIVSGTGTVITTYGSGYTPADQMNLQSTFLSCLRMTTAGTVSINISPNGGYT